MCSNVSVYRFLGLDLHRKLPGKNLGLVAAGPSQAVAKSKQFIMSFCHHAYLMLNSNLVLPMNLDFETDEVLKLSMLHMR